MSTVHLILVITTLLVVAYADEQGLMWMLGKRDTLSKKTFERLHTIVGIGLSLIILTGGLMFIDRAQYLLNNPTFIVKMVLVLALVINSFAINIFGKISHTRPFSQLSPAEKKKLFVSGAVSSVAWLGAATCGLLL